MFVQVIIGQVADAEGLRDTLRRWVVDLAPGATGWLGTTAGMTAEGTFVGLARFASAAAARQNSDRAEQYQWWLEAAKAFHTEPIFYDCDRPLVFLGGPSERAGFVQIVQRRTTAPERLRELIDHNSEEVGRARPDVIGGVVAIAGDGTVNEAVYFTSETAARHGERQELPPRLAAQFARAADLATTDRYLDLTDPWHYPAR